MRMERIAVIRIFSLLLFRNPSLVQTIFVPWLGKVTGSQKWWRRTDATLTAPEWSAAELAGGASPQESSVPRNFGRAKANRFKGEIAPPRFGAQNSIVCRRTEGRPWPRTCWVP